MADQDVALVGVGVEGAHVQHLMQVVVHDHPPQFLRIDPLRRQLVRVGDGAAVDVGHGEDALGGQLVDDGGAGDPRFVVQTLFLEQAGVRRLHAEIQLVLGDLLQLRDHRLEVDDLAVGILLHDVHQVRQLVEEQEILAHHVGDQGPLHLGDHPGAVLEYAVVGLADGRGS